VSGSHPETAPAERVSPSLGHLSRNTLLGIAGTTFAVLVLGGVLWSRFGGGVFFDMLATNFVNCFF